MISMWTRPEKLLWKDLVACGHSCKMNAGKVFKKIVCSRNFLHLLKTLMCRKLVGKY